MPDVVLMVNIAVAEPFEGTVTLAGDHEAVAPGILPQLRAVRFTTPVKPETLVNVALKLVDDPAVMVLVAGEAEALKLPEPL